METRSSLPSTDKNQKIEAEKPSPQEFMQRFLHALLREQDLSLPKPPLPSATPPNLPMLPVLPVLPILKEEN